MADILPISFAQIEATAMIRCVGVVLEEMLRRGGVLSEPNGE